MGCKLTTAVTLPDFTTRRSGSVRTPMESHTVSGTLGLFISQVNNEICTKMTEHHAPSGLFMPLHCLGLWHLIIKTLKLLFGFKLGAWDHKSLWKNEQELVQLNQPTFTRTAVI